MKGKLIVFEGVDGCGKTTQLKLTHSYLWDLDKKTDVYTTREPTRDFKETRERMAKGVNVKEDAEWYTEAFIQDRKNHLKYDIIPRINRGSYVLCDRYKYSTLAYQHTQGINLERLIDMHSGLLIPDLILIFDCPAEIAFERRKKKAKDVFEKDLKFQKKLRKNYLELKDILSDENIVIINTEPPIEEVFEEIKKYIQKIL